MGKIQVDHTGAGGGITLSSDGTDLLLDGTAIGGGGAALELYAENPSTPTTPSATGANAVAIGSSSIAVTGAGAMALGGSYASGTNSIAAAVASNLSSYGATGYSSVVIGNAAKASGGSSCAIGRSAISSSSYSTAIGYGAASSGGSSFSAGSVAAASGSNAFAIGSLSVASASSSIAIGSYAKSDIIGKFAYANGTSDYQAGFFILRSDTTDATAEALTTSNTAASTDNQVILPNNSVYGFTGTIIARENSAQTDDFAVWEVKGGAVRGASASTTALGSYNINKISESAGATNWTIALSADTTNGAVAITVTGEAAHNIRWVATINTAEVTY